jgi:hypothetical protein
MNKSLAAIPLLLFVAGANAAITASLVDRGQLGLGTRTYDVTVTVTDDPNDPDDWIACWMSATLTGCCTFVDVPYNPPQDPCWWDSFFTVPMFFPNTPDWGSVSFADPDAVIEEPLLRFGEWYDTDNTGSGEFVLHRLTMLCDEDCTEECWLTVHFETAAQNTGAQFFPFDWSVMVCVPEPGSLALLALGGLTLIRRR